MAARSVKAPPSSPERTECVRTDIFVILPTTVSQTFGLMYVDFGMSRDVTIYGCTQNSDFLSSFLQSQRQRILDLFYTPYMFSDGRSHGGRFGVRSKCFNRTFPQTHFDFLSAQTTGPFSILFLISSVDRWFSYIQNQNTGSIISTPEPGVSFRSCC